MNQDNNEDILQNCLICVTGHISSEERRRAVFDLLNSLKKENLNVCYLTHSPNYIDEMSKIVDYVFYDEKNLLINTFDYTNNIALINENKINEGAFFIDFVTYFGRYYYHKISEHTPAVLKLLKNTVGISYLNNYKWTILIDYDLISPINGFRKFLEEKIKQLQNENKKAFLYQRNDYDFMLFTCIVLFETEKLFFNDLLMKKNWYDSASDWINNFNLSFSEMIIKKIFYETFNANEILLEDVNKDVEKFWQKDNYNEITKFHYDNTAYTKSLIKILAHKKNDIYDLYMFIDNYPQDTLIIERLEIFNLSQKNIIYSINAKEIYDRGIFYDLLNKNLFTYTDTLILNCQYKYKKDCEIRSFIEKYDLKYIHILNKYLGGIIFNENQ